MADEQKDFELKIKNYLKQIETNQKFLNLTELSDFISSHSNRLSMKNMLAYCRQHGIELDAYRKINKAHLIKVL